MRLSRASRYIARLAAYREMINAHLIAAIETSSRSPEGMLMPNPQIMYGARMQAAEQLPEMMHLVRDLSDCQISLVPSASSFENPEIADTLNKYFTVGDDDGHERRKMLTFARDLLNSHYAGHRLTFQLFAQSPPFSHQLAMYNNYDFGAVSDLVHQAANLEADLDVEHAKKADFIEEAGDLAMRPAIARESDRRAEFDDPLHQAAELAKQVSRP